MNPAIALSFFTKKKTKDMSVDFPQDATRLKVVVNAGDIVSLYSTYIDSAYLDVAKVEWGDGESGMLRDHSTSIGGGLYECSHYEHQYAQAGTYNIDIKGACIIGISSVLGRDKIVQICSTDSAFEEVTRELCENTTSLEIVDFTPIQLHLIDSVAFRGSAVKVIRCSRVEEINTDRPFYNTPNLTDIYLTEHSASEIEGLPAFPFGAGPSVKWHFNEDPNFGYTVIGISLTDPSDLTFGLCDISVATDDDTTAVVEWGDGTTSPLYGSHLVDDYGFKHTDLRPAGWYGHLTHTYTEVGDYTIRIKGAKSVNLFLDPTDSQFVHTYYPKVTSFGSSDPKMTYIEPQFLGFATIDEVNLTKTNVDYIESKAFQGFQGSVIRLPSTIETIGVFAFGMNNSEMVDIYLKDTAKADFLERYQGEFPFGANHVTWHFSDGTETYDN